MGKKIEFLEGIRSFCIIAVMLHHFLFAFFPAMVSGNIDQSHSALNIEAFIARTPLNVFYNGNFAFFLLFIISGFVLSYKFFKTKDISVVQQSAAKRYFRLVVPVFSSVFVAYWFMRFNLFFHVPVAKITLSYNWLIQSWNFVPNFLNMVYEGLIGTFLSGSSNYNSVLWMMRYEFIGSFLVYSFLALFGKFRARYVLYIVLGLIFMQTFYLSFILGIVLADLYVQNHPLLRKIHPVLLVGLTIVGLYFASYPIAMKTANTMYGLLRFPFIKGYAAFYHSVGAALLLLVVFNTDWIKKFLSLRSLASFAKLAFSLYLFHQIVLFSLTCFLFLFLQDKLPYFYNVVVSGLLSLAVLLAVAFAAYTYIEKPSQKFTQFVFEKLFVSL